MMNSESLRLLDIPVTWPPDSQRFVSCRLEALAKAGVKIQIVSSFPGKINPSLSPYADVIRVSHTAEHRAIWIFRALAGTAKLILRRPGRLLSFLRIGWRHSSSVSNLIRWWALNIPLSLATPDLVHYEWTNAAVDYRWLPEFLNCPYVVSCRGRQINILPHLHPGSQLVRDLSESLQGAAGIHGVSRHILQEASQLGADPSKCFVVYTSVDSEFFVPPLHSTSPTEGSLRIITIGVSIWRKGYEYLLSAIKLTVESGIAVELTIVDWGGEERDRLDYTIADLGLTKCVRVQDRMSREEIRTALWESDVCVLSALSEGISNSVIEAMACGLPVITTDCGGMQEAVTDGIEGLIVPTRTPESIAAALLKLTADADLRQRMGDAGRQRVVQQFSPDNQAQQFLKLYRTALANSSRHMS